jgi:hypothetical protein
MRERGERAMSFDPKYRMRFKPAPISRLSKYKKLPPPMTDTPDEARAGVSWEKRCEIIYGYMMAIKHGITPVPSRRGLWFYSERGHKG